MTDRNSSDHPEPVRPSWAKDGDFSEVLGSLPMLFTVDQEDLFDNQVNWLTRTEEGSQYRIALHHSLTAEVEKLSAKSQGVRDEDFKEVGIPSFSFLLPMISQLIRFFSFMLIQESPLSDEEKQVYSEKCFSTDILGTFGVGNLCACINIILTFLKCITTTAESGKLNISPAIMDLLRDEGGDP